MPDLTPERTCGSGGLLTLNLKEPALSCVYESLRKHGFEATTVYTREGETCVHLQPTRAAIELEASIVALVKPLVDNESTAVAFEPFDLETRLAYRDVDSDGFFSAAETCFLTRRLLYEIEVEADIRAAIPQIGELREQQPTLTSLLPVLQHLRLCSEWLPIHEPKFDKQLAPGLWRFPSVDTICDYFGQNVAIYFAWMQFMQWWYIAPGVVGLAIFIVHNCTGLTVESSPLVPLFSVGVIVWGVLLIKFWRRYAASLSLQWGTLWLDHREQDEPHPEFKGIVRLSPVTGRPELHFPVHKRVPRYLLSVLVTAVMLAVAFAVMVCSLNLQGYIQNPEDDFYVGALAQFSAPGAVFDPRSGNPVLPLVPVVLHVVTIIILNQKVYCTMAAWLTAFENHATLGSHRASFVLKRFLFEAFDCYIALFYLAFWRLDILLVRQELRALFTADCVRRVVTESALPFLLRRAKGASSKSKMAKLKEEIKEKPGHVEAVDESSREEYSDFDDYLEMVIQFGYVTLFAAAMPFAAAVGCLYIAVERRNDLFKLVYLSQRPRAGRAKDIGIWEVVLQMQAWLAILTNCMVFAFSSDQIISYAPALFRQLSLPTGAIDVVVAEGSGRWLVTIMAVLEHALILVALVLWFVIPDEPGHVQQARAKRQFVLDEELRAVHAEKRARINERKHRTSVDQT